MLGQPLVFPCLSSAPLSVFFWQEVNRSGPKVPPCRAGVGDPGATLPSGLWQVRGHSGSDVSFTTAVPRKPRTF